MERLITFFLFLPPLLACGVIVFINVCTCVIYFSGETKFVKVDEVYPLGVRDATATVLIVDEGIQYEVHSCPKEVKKGDEIEVFSLSIFGNMICTYIWGFWIVLCILVSIALGGGCFVIIKDIILSEE